MEYSDVAQLSHDQRGSARIAEPSQRLQCGAARLTLGSSKMRPVIGGLLLALRRSENLPSLAINGRNKSDSPDQRMIDKKR
jgi:hypothetical protein